MARIGCSGLLVVEQRSPSRPTAKFCGSGLGARGKLHVPKGCSSDGQSAGLQNRMPQVRFLPPLPLISDSTSYGPLPESRATAAVTP